MDLERLVIAPTEDTSSDDFNKKVREICDTYKLTLEFNTNIGSNNYCIIKVTKETGMKAHQMMTIITEEKHPEVGNCVMITKEEYRIMTS